MKATIDTNAIYPAVDYKAIAAEMKKFIEQQPKTRENALRWLVGTGMYTKTGKLKKQFR
jgi:Asp-tRNA(Asn)/Glu-tRNA(Gln) amidotransferase B subunit